MLVFAVHQIGDGRWAVLGPDETDICYGGIRRIGLVSLSSVPPLPYLNCSSSSTAPVSRRAINAAFPPTA